MKKNQILFTIIIAFTTIAHGQSLPVWNQTYGSLTVTGIVLNLNEPSLLVWGSSIDTCGSIEPTFLKIDTNGSNAQFRYFEFAPCANEGTIRCIPNSSGSGYYFITTNDVITPQDSSYMHYLDANLSMLWSSYIGQNIRSGIIEYGGKYYLSSDNFSMIRQVLRTDGIGNVDTLNSITDQYFTWAPNKIACENGIVIEIFNQVDYDTAFKCLVYDTVGNYFTSFVFDADSSQQEVPWFAGVSNNQLFSVNSAFMNSLTYPAACGVTGVVNWIDTLNHKMHNVNGACIDSINNIGFVLCDVPTSLAMVFSYDLNTGDLLDSVMIDSVSALFTGIKSGPSGGVYFAYRKLNTTQIFVEQFDQGLNLIWIGSVVHPTCSLACDPKDFIIDSVGNFYLLSYCGTCPGATTLVSKFSPSLVGLDDAESNSNCMQIDPNPASSLVKIVVGTDFIDGNVLIYDLAGKCEISAEFSGSDVVLDISTLNSGFYIVEINGNNNQRFTQKLIIQHQ